MKYLIVVDMQKDFIDGALGTKEAQAIVPNVRKKIEEFDGEVIFTRDTHHKDYLCTVLREPPDGRLIRACSLSAKDWL